ncbi:MAG: hypothetical protein JNL32_03265, partial [Candidatus Kapabacteria bacterium]|nr:hypothetical protein [Candidatus Kapabacteria bacterium]
QFFMPKALLKESPISKVSYEMYTEKAKVYEDDKKGINATFRFLKFLHSIRNENLNDVVAEAENLMKYHVRNFTTRENLRSSSVIKMINELATHNFDTSRIRISVLSKFMINLIDTKNDPVAMNDPSEIIPFEALWDLVINLVVEHNHGLLRPVRKRKKTEPGMPKEPKFVFSAEQLRVIAAYVSYGKRSRGRPRHFATVEELHQYEMEQQKQLTGS